MYVRFLSLLICATNLFAGEFAPDANTVALWHFNEGTGSAFANAKGGSGTLYGNYQWVDGRFGKAIKLDGSTAYGNFNLSNPPSRNCTYEIWYKPTDIANNKGCVTMGWGVYNSGITVVKDSIVLAEFVDRGTTSGTFLAFTQGATWYYIAFVISDDSTLQALYVNGQKVGNLRALHQPSWSSLWLGVDRTFGYNGFNNGTIDEVRVSNIARTSSDIRAYWESNNPPINNPPGFISTPDTTATEGVLWSYVVTAVDVDAGDTVAYSLRSPPAGMVIVRNTVSWTPSNSSVGVNTVTIRATDSRGAFSDQTFRVRVANVNDAPLIVSAAPTTAVQNQPFQYQAQASDSDAGEVLTWRLLVAPQGMSVSSSGLVSWTPSPAQVGASNVVLQVQDAGGLANTQSFTITVININDPPVITDPAAQRATEDISFSLQLTATDADGNQIFWFVVQGPESLAVNMNTGLVTWTPRQNVAGTSVQVRIRATDAVLSDTTLFSISVTAVNDPPVITTVLPSTFSTDTLYAIPLTAMDEENDQITWTVPRKPPTMSIVANSLVWAPTTVGLDTIMIIASDGNSADTLVQVVQVLSGSSTLRQASTLAVPKSLAIASAVHTPTRLLVGVGLPVSASSATVSLYDTNGRRVAHRQVTGCGWHTVSFASVSRGAYFVRLSAAGSNVTAKTSSQ